MTKRLYQQCLLATMACLALQVGVSQAQKSWAHRPYYNQPIATKKTSIDYPLAAQDPRIYNRAVYYYKTAEYPPTGCYTTFNDYSCSSLQSERDFIFGSCLIFFGERCLNGPPPDPVAVYLYNQRLYKRSGDHTIPNYGRIPVFGTTPETMPPPPIYRDRFGPDGKRLKRVCKQSSSCDCPTCAAARHQVLQYPVAQQPCDCDR